MKRMAEMKSFKTIEEQVAILKERGLIITDEYRLKKYLSNYNYYRLSGYSLRFRNKDEFKAYTYDEHIYQSFDIDEKMRLLLLKLCFVVEAKLKTKIAYVLGEKGPIEYLKNDIYNEYNTIQDDGSYKKDTIFKASFEYIQKNNAAIFEHHRDKYNGSYPIWVIIHFLTFGEVVKLYNILNSDDRQRIAIDFTDYIVSSRDFERYIEAINCLRNACAHGDRIINKGLSRSVPLFCFDKRVFQYITISIKNNDKILTNLYGHLVALTQLLSKEKELLKDFYNEFASLFTDMYLIKPDDYGFVGDWWRNIKMPVDIYKNIKNINHEYKGDQIEE